MDVIIFSFFWKVVLCLVIFVIGWENSMVKFIFWEEGLYVVDVIYDGYFVFGSFYIVEVLLLLDFSKVKVYGFGFEGGFVGKFVEFIIDIKGVGIGGLGLMVEGLCEVKIECFDNGDGICFVFYFFIKFGEYFVNIFFEEVYIFGFFFKVDIEMFFDFFKVVVLGLGFEYGKVGEVGFFSVDCLEVGLGVLGLEVVLDLGIKVEVSI